MPYEIKLQLVKLENGGKTSIVRDTVTAAACERIEEAELLLEYLKNQAKIAAPFARPLAVE